MERLVELVRLWLWYAARGLVASGAAWCGGYSYFTAVPQDPPRPRACRERQLRRELARGLAEIEDYLGAQRPVPGRRGPRRSTGNDARG